MSAKNSYLLILAGVVFFAVAAFLIIPEFLGSSPLAQREPLPVRSFQESPRNFDGNRYQVTGVISEQLARDESRGRLILVEAGVEGSLIPLFLPRTIDANLSPGQRFLFNIQINQGILYVQDLKKL